MISPVSGHAGHGVELLESGIPHLGGEYRTGLVVVLATAASAGDEHFPIRQQGRIRMPSNVGHRRDLPPCWSRLIEVDHFDARRRRNAAPGDQYFSHVVHHPGALFTEPAGGGVVDEGPTPGAGSVQIAGCGQRTGTEYAAVWSYKVEVVPFPLVRHRGRQIS